VSMAGKMNEGYHQFKVGDLDCLVVSDGSRSISSMTTESPRTFIFGDAPDAELDAALSPYGNFEGSHVLPFNYLAVMDAKGWILIDTGCGDQAENDKNPNEPAGLLPANLARAKISPDDVTRVILSHCHWDHFGGAVADGKPAYPNARCLMSAAEAAHIRNRVKGWALDYLQVIEPKMRLVEEAAEVAPGIGVHLAPGHTPGLLTVSISSKGESLLYLSDLVIHPIHVEHPDWCPSFETNREAAATSRRNSIEDACRMNRLVHAPHVRSPGLGRIERVTGGYLWADA
jgi:glyoxylase-like metal-dependent hydrolase (beta-lactamase superfamily II)